MKKTVLFSGGLFVLLLAFFLGVQSAIGDKPHESQKTATVTLDQARQWILTGDNLEQIPLSVWKQMLDEKSYYVLWNEGTERAFTGALLKENRKGVFVSAGCRIPVFKSEHKYKSGTGWPSFWEVFDQNNIILKEDRSWGMRRIEVLSACGEHLGHVFEDGPEPTGLRYCINSAALAFVPSGQADPVGPFAAE